jgi:broad-specificity NMP kinase
MGRIPTRSSSIMAAVAGRCVKKKIMAGPVIIITGTPGTGKTTHAELLAETSTVPLEHINVGEWVKERGLHEGFDSEWQAYTVDEDKVRTSPARSMECGSRRQAVG